MISTQKISIIIIILLFLSACVNINKENNNNKRTKIEMQTDHGNIIIELYNSTPKHRDNFVKLANEGAFDSLLFHRVIENFMIQGGDPDSKYASADDTLGEGDLPYTIDAEIQPKLFHKKGVLAAAREDNPECASSAMQFYLVQGKVYNDSLLQRAEARINSWLAQNIAKQDTSNKLLVEAINNAHNKNNRDDYLILIDSLENTGRKNPSFVYYHIPETHRNIYKKIGGTPFLDQNYTVFGEIISGLEIVDSIAAVPTGIYDRPIKDVRIIKVRTIE